MKILEALPWPGNIRELRNVVTKAAVLAQNPEISAGELRLWLSLAGPEDHEDASGDLGSIEKNAILQALADTEGHQQKAAARLGISRRTLTRKLKLYRPPSVVLA
jgi:DNA-binding NtrC family response regulator